MTLGGDATERAALGDIVGPSFPREAISGAVETVVETYLAHRHRDERFLDTYRRLGLEPFKRALYAPH